MPTSGPFLSSHLISLISVRLTPSGSQVNKTLNPVIIPGAQHSDLSPRVTRQGDVWALTVHNTHQDTFTRCQDLKLSAWLPETDFVEP